MTETLMPGGGVARRPLHFIVVADCSGSMKGEKMQALNYALRSMLPHLVTWERDQVQAQLLVRVLAFATVPRWHVPGPLPVADLERRALRPAILLITDGLPTDPPGGFESGLGELLGTPAGRSALRVGVAIGRDANSEPLNRFRSPDTPILVADSTDDIVERLVAASIAVSRLSGAGADPGALAQTLMQPAAGSGPGPDDDSIL
jgi:uncharacterized protein YegL